MIGASAFGEQAVLVTGQLAATEAGLDVLREGGNAVDAAICAALVLTVATPYAVSLAGDAFLLIGSPDGDIHGLNGSGCAPAAAALREGQPIARSGARSATVPGLLQALADAHARFGTLPLERLIDPAIALADEGFAISDYFYGNIVDRLALIEQDAAACDTFLDGGMPKEVGTIFRQPALAVILKALRRDGLDDFYRGRIARQFADAVAHGGGWISAADMAAHSSLWQKPIAAPFQGHDVWTMPPNSYGPTLLLQLLALERGGIPATEADWIARGFAARRAAYAALADAIGDPEECEAIVRARIAYAVDGGEAAAARAFAEATDRCTTNVVAIDKAGWSVSLIESISTPFGAGVVLEDMGIVLNNRLAGFSADPASRNALRPGKRPAHTLAPCLVTQDGRVTMSIGTPGTVGQTCVLAQLLARLLACCEEPGAAIKAPRWSADFDGSLIVEPAISADTRNALEAHGLTLKVKPQGFVSFGSVKLARRSAAGFEGYADHRRVAGAGAL